jgi:3-oxoacyl-[acyl-carrier protein] reductase
MCFFFKWDKMLEVHCTAVFRLVRAAAKYMRDPAKAELESGQVPKDRVIINISSTSGLHGNAGQINYATAKLGVVGLTKTVAKEWGNFGVRCNAVAFGFIQTRLTEAKESGAVMKVGDKEVKLGIPKAGLSAKVPCPLGRAGHPDEAAAGIVLLASPLSSYITGHTLEVTGGAGI